MRVLHGNTFLFFGDKNVSKVSGVWKALHISIYVAIAVSAFITAMAVGNMFQTFKYNCILFCSDVRFETEVLLTEHFNHIKSTTAENRKSFDTEKTASNIIGNGTDQNIIETIVINETVSQNSSTDAPDFKSVNKNDDPTEAVGQDTERILFKNQTHIFETEDDTTVIITHGKIDIGKTRFGSNFWCNFVLGLALLTFIFATFCGVILAMCSKGGKGRENTLNRPQNMLYPILVSSLALGILNFAASVIVKNGMQDFCANFELFTEVERCSPAINQFTLHERQQRFYLPYIVLSYSFPLTVILFACQLLVTLLRIMYAVDYQLYSLEVEHDDDENDFEIEDGQVKERAL